MCTMYPAMSLLAVYWAVKGVLVTCINRTLVTVTVPLSITVLLLLLLLLLIFPKPWLPYDLLYVLFSAPVIFVDRLDLST